MAKTKLELLREAAALLRILAEGGIAEVSGGFLARTSTSLDVLAERSRQWLQEEVSDSDSSESQSDEPPTDDRWFAAYLKGIEAWGRIWAGTGFNAPMEPHGAFAKRVADNALAAAREQAREKPLAKTTATE